MTGWRYASSVTPGVLSSLQVGQQSRAAVDGDDILDSGECEKNGDATDCCTAFLAQKEKNPRCSLDCRLWSAGEKPSPETTEDQQESTIELGRRLAGLIGGRRRSGPGPGAALWTSKSQGGGIISRPRRSKKAKVQRLVKHLEAALKLRGQASVEGFPDAPQQKIDLPYTKELAKWGYDKILGIPQAPVPGRASSLDM